MHDINKGIRLTIFDSMKQANIPWHGILGQRTFLSRLCDLTKIPTHDSDVTMDKRLMSWDFKEPDFYPEWIFDDEQINLVALPDDDFLTFICETINSNVQPDADDRMRLLGIYNRNLAEVGWEIVDKQNEHGFTECVARRKITNEIVDESDVKETIEKLNPDYINNQIKRMEDARWDDPESAIGTAKDLVETICKSILDYRGEEYKQDEKIPELVKKVCDTLSILSSHIPNSEPGARSIRELLKNIAVIGQRSAELRNLFGTGHGKSSDTIIPGERVAKLAINASKTLVVFLLQTFQDQDDL